MRREIDLESLLAYVLLCVALVAGVMLTSNEALAGPSARDGAAESSLRPSHTPTIPTLGYEDRVSALENVQFALTSLSDGASYVWHRAHGRMSGVVQPTSSFQAADGRICRHFVLVLSAGRKSGRTEAVACQLKSGIWRFES